MRAVGIKVLKDRLSEYVRMAAAGETVLVTDRDEVVAELGPPAASRARNVSDAVLANLVEEGLLSIALAPQWPLPPRVPTMLLEELLGSLAADREER